MNKNISEYIYLSLCIMSFDTRCLREGFISPPTIPSSTCVWLRIPYTDTPVKQEITYIRWFKVIETAALLLYQLN